MSEGNIITFYSYKGGVGRTFALASIGALLSIWGYKTLCIDWDLEAPGLDLYFSPWLRPSNQPGLTELIQAYVDGTDPKWQDFVTEISLPNSRQPLSLIKAGLQDDSYIQRMQRLDWENLYASQDLGNFLERMRQEWKQTFDFILIDSRTGITDIGGICTIQMPDFIVLLFTANAQSLYGAIDVVQRAKRLRDSLPFDRSKLLVLPVVTRFESRVEYALAQEWLEIFATQLTPLFEEWTSSKTTASELLNFTKIPYVPYWSFGEKIPVLEEGTRDPESIGFVLETLTALLVRELSNTEQLVRNRDTFVNLVHRLQKSPIRVFVSYADHDENLMEQLRTHLQVLLRQGIIRTWSERKVIASDEWQKLIDDQINQADLILLLVSPDYLASASVWEGEIKHTIERQEQGNAIVIPIIARAVDWQASPFAHLQVLPSDAKPITTWSDQDAAFANVSQGIRRAIENLRG
jgi:MinD-like ATPase involved in chromosome partitioning or flagellar assembly